ncbi:hypothetical protein VTP01DRAFT_10710, partial [Rhizomucor pusillus]|uniref:uncharacterized protein n=1 Tax=Rhizomucor pusillus TaxID=4840 RepID=UPI0037438DC5
MKVMARSSGIVKGTLQYCTHGERMWHKEAYKAVNTNTDNEKYVKWYAVCPYLNSSQGKKIRYSKPTCNIPHSSFISASYKQQAFFDIDTIDDYSWSSTWLPNIPVPLKRCLRIRTFVSRDRAEQRSGDLIHQPRSSRRPLACNSDKMYCDIRCVFTVFK